jgi:hypothetical protein
MKLLLLALCTAPLFASIIDVTTPVQMTGSGTFVKDTSYSFGLPVIIFSASGTNGTDTISISGVMPVIGGNLSSLAFGPNAIGSQFSVGGGFIECIEFAQVMNQSTCGVSIDGILASGPINFGIINEIGDGLSLVQIYSSQGGTLLAQAEIEDLAVITGVTVSGITNPVYSGTFDITPTPEPSTWALCLVGILCGLLAGTRRGLSDWPRGR